MLKALHEMGVRSDHAYLAGLGSIVLSLIAWLSSRRASRDNKPQADRWGIFIGHWAPTFFAIGVGLRLEEQDD
ncbi:hypothetical protein [Desertihabitans aurantiacus]|uniref:hypothetical protein n=1 Tax=Desertihabitans aurantiacus TaxID=2282477 RepID=UPI000DF7D9B6|nr:hypothetical protein [Desertihabitans aurantiacus]